MIKYPVSRFRFLFRSYCLHFISREMVFWFCNVSHNITIYRLIYWLQIAQKIDNVGTVSIFPFNHRLCITQKMFHICVTILQDMYHCGLYAAYDLLRENGLVCRRRGWKSSSYVSFSRYYIYKHTVNHIAINHYYLICFPWLSTGLIWILCIIYGRKLMGFNNY